MNIITYSIKQIIDLLYIVSCKKTPTQFFSYNLVKS